MLRTAHRHSAASARHHTHNTAHHHHHYHYLILSADAGTRDRGGHCFTRPRPSTAYRHSSCRRASSPRSHRRQPNTASRSSFILHRRTLRHLSVTPRMSLATTSPCSSRCAFLPSQPAAVATPAASTPRRTALEGGLPRPPEPVLSVRARRVCLALMCAAAAHPHAQQQSFPGVSQRSRHRLRTSTRTHTSSPLTGERRPHCRCRRCAAASSKPPTHNPAGAFVLAFGAISRLGSTRRSILQLASGRRCYGRYWAQVSVRRTFPLAIEGCCPPACPTHVACTGPPLPLSMPAAIAACVAHKPAAAPGKVAAIRTPRRLPARFASR